MKLKSLLQRFFLGSEIIERVFSPVNGKIVVQEDLFGHREVIAGKVAQSGGLAEILWKTVKINPAEKVLILGLGCGTLAKILSEKYPKAKITGIEIDPVIVNLGKKYFDLDKIPNLEIITGDAFEFVKKEKSQFDLVIVDLYLGQEFPKEAESDEFLNKLNGLIVFNRLYYNSEHRKRADKFLLRVKEFFPEVVTQQAVTNLLILATHKAKSKV